MPGVGRSLIGLAIVALAAGAACTSLPGNTGEPPQQQRDTDASGMTYADDALCAECHRAAADAFMRTASTTWKNFMAWNEDGGRRLRVMAGWIAFVVNVLCES